MTVWLVLWTLLPLLSPTTGEDPNQIRIASFNLLNLFDNVDEPGKDDEGTNPKAVEELQVIARTIDSLDADVIGVQEVENRAVLERLNEHLARPFPHVELLEGNDGRGIDCGLLSRFPMEAAISHRLRDLEGGARFSRDFPVFRLRLNARDELAIGVVHLKSKGGSKAQSDRQRRREAETVSALVKRYRQREPAVPFVVLGDFNDTRESTPLAPLFALLEDPTQRIPEERRYSYVYRGQPEQIDFILTTPDLKTVASDALHADNSGSDHAPLWVDCRIERPVVRHTAKASRKWEPVRRPAIAANDLEGFERLLLREIAVTGEVVKVHRPNAGAAILNFARDYKKAITVYIPADAFPRLPDLDSLVGRTVTARGPVCRRGPLGEGVYSIRVTQASQLTAGRQ